MNPYGITTNRARFNAADWAAYETANRRSVEEYQRRLDDTNKPCHSCGQPRNPHRRFCSLSCYWAWQAAVAARKDAA